MTDQIEHRHIPIPDIIRGRAQRNIGIRPGTNRCIECGMLVPDSPGTEDRWQAFLFREMQFEELHPADGDACGVGVIQAPHPSWKSYSKETDRIEQEE